MNTSKYTSKDIDRFWSKVSKSDDPNACWEWTASKDIGGYGQIGIGGRPENGGKTLKTHRVAWELAYGEIPSGLLVCHHCDNPKCVRADHLFLGTDADNALDKSMKGRCPKINEKNRGEYNGSAKLTWTDVREIRSRYQRWSEKNNTTTLAKEFGMAQSIISAILRNEIWVDKTYVPSNHGVKLSIDDVRYIRNRYAQGDISQRKLAQQFGVSGGLIGHIINNRTWKETINE